MKLRYIILLCVSILCIVVCVCLQITYQNILEDDGEALESLRDSIKEFETNLSNADSMGTDATSETT
ncbi:MAG: hypothetical protein J6S41_02875, partial [Clostridia bacterium]|nr:hypothetical protein [Clostridia bacterium]